MKIHPFFTIRSILGNRIIYFKALLYPNELRTLGLPIPILISAESFSVAEQYALNIYLLLRDIPVLISGLFNTFWSLL